MYFMEKHHLFYLEPIKLVPKWRFFHNNEEAIAKRLDRFLVSESLLSGNYFWKTWVSKGGLFGHHPILVSILDEGKLKLSPFSFNPIWLKEEYFCVMVAKNWVYLSSSSGSSEYESSSFSASHVYNFFELSSV